MQASDQIGLGARTTIGLGITIVIGPEGTRRGLSFELCRSFGSTPFLVFKIEFCGELSEERGFVGYLIGFFFAKISYFCVNVGLFWML